MTRDEFIQNYLLALNMIPVDDSVGHVILHLIGSIHDLQEQINQLEERMNEHEDQHYYSRNDF